MVAFRKHVLPVFCRPRPSIVGGERPMVFLGLCSDFRDIFSLISLLLLGMRLYVVVALPPDGRCLSVWGRMRGGVSFGNRF